MKRKEASTRDFFIALTLFIVGTVIFIYLILMVISLGGDMVASGETYVNDLMPD